MIILKLSNKIIGEKNLIINEMFVVPVRSMMIYEDIVPVTPAASVGLVHAVFNVVLVQLPHPWIRHYLRPSQRKPIFNQSSQDTKG